MIVVSNPLLLGKSHALLVQSLNSPTPEFHPIHHPQQQYCGGRLLVEGSKENTVAPSADVQLIILATYFCQLGSIIELHSFFLHPFLGGGRHLTPR